MTKALLARNSRNQQRLKNTREETPTVLKVRAAQRARTQKPANDLSKADQLPSTEREEQQPRNSDDSDRKNTAQTKAANTERKQKSTGKRKKSGLTPKSIYLHDNVHKQFEELADNLDYEIGSKGLSSEQLSMLVQFLLDSYQKPTDSSTPLTREGQYLYRTHQIVKYRSTVMGDTIDEIVDFMTKSKYLVPDSYAPKSKYDWTSQIIVTLLDKDSLSKRIKLLNGSPNIEDNSLTERETNESEYTSEAPDVLYTGGVADLKEQIRKSEVIELGSSSKDPDTLYTGGVADLKKQIRKNGIIEQILSGSFTPLVSKFGKKAVYGLKVSHLTSLSDKDLFRHVSMEEHGRILTQDEVFEIYRMERRALVKRIREVLTNSNQSRET